MVRNPQRVVASWLRKPVPSGWSSATRGTCATGGRDPPVRGTFTLYAPSRPRRVPASRHTTDRLQGAGAPCDCIGGPLGGPANSNAQWRGAANALKAGAAHAGPGCIGPAEPKLLPSRAGRRRWRVRVSSAEGAQGASQAKRQRPAPEAALQLRASPRLRVSSPRPAAPLEQLPVRQGIGATSARCTLEPWPCATCAAAT